MAIVIRATYEYGGLVWWLLELFAAVLEDEDWGFGEWLEFALADRTGSSPESADALLVLPLKTLLPPAESPSFIDPKFGVIAARTKNLLASV